MTTLLHVPQYRGKTTSFGLSGWTQLNSFALETDQGPTPIGPGAGRAAKKITVTGMSMAFGDREFATSMFAAMARGTYFARMTVMHGHGGNWTSYLLTGVVVAKCMPGGEYHDDSMEVAFASWAFGGLNEGLTFTLVGA